MNDPPVDPLQDRLALLLANGEATKLARRLAWRMRGVQDRVMRRTVMASVLTALDDGELVAMLHEILAGAERGNGDCREVLQEMSMGGNLLLELPYDRIADLYQTARSAGLDAVTRLFTRDRPRGHPTVEEASLENDFLDLSLGERKAVARLQNRFALDRVLHDRNPSVIAHFLNNPRAVERDVVRIAAMRPTQPAILRLIASHPRWSGRYEVRKALACNCYTPESIAIRIAHTLLRQDLIDMLQAPGLAPGLRLMVQERHARLAMPQETAKRDVEPA